MFGMFMNSVTLFLKGKLFQNIGSVMAKLAIGVLIGAVLLVGLALFGLPVWLAVLIASAVSGMAQPFLFKNLKYA